MRASTHSLQTYFWRKMTLLVFFLGVLLSPLQTVWAVTIEIAKWDFASNTGTGAAPSSASCFTSCSASSSSLSSSAVTSGVWSTKKWTTDTARNLGYYVEFKVSTANHAGIKLSFTEVRASTTSPTAFQVEYSSDGSTYTVFGSSLLASSSTAQRDFDLSAITAINNNAQTSFRIYAWGATGTATGGWILDDVTITGTSSANVAPTANPVSITGIPKSGEILTGHYTYHDDDNDSEGTSTFQWYTASDASGTGATPIASQTSSTYTVAVGVGTFVCFEATPVAQTGTTLIGSPVRSSCTEILAATANVPPVASSVAFTGSLKQGQTLTGTYSYSDADTNPESGSTFQWYRADDVAATGSTPISGAINTTYTPTLSDFGKFISFEVTPKASAGASPGTAKKSPYQGPITNDAPVASSVTITGTPKVGQTLTGNYTYTDSESDPVGTPSFQWYTASDTAGAGANAISGQTSSTYIVAVSVGTFVCVEITPKATTGTTSGSPIKSPCVEILNAAADAAPTASGVTINGTTTVGQTLTGIYTFSDAESATEGTSLFKWYRANDTAGTGASQVATTLTYTLMAADVGKYLRFEVTPVAVTGTTTGTMVPSGYVGAVADIVVANYTLNATASGSGSVSASGNSFPNGSTVSLTATPSSGYTFAGWSPSPCASSFAMPAYNLTCTATFNAPPPPPPVVTFGLGLKKDGMGTGKVSSDTGMECGGYCTDNFESSKTVILTATPDVGSVFAKFTCSSGETSTQPSLSVRMNAVKICTATFNQVPKYKLSITVQGKATGTVTTQPAAISSCGTGCLEFYQGTQVTLIPQPAAGAAFTEWSSNCSDGKITINSAGNSCTANFMPLYTLTVATAGTGQGSVTSTPAGIECGNGKTLCSKIYGEGVSVSLTPTPVAGFAFAGWNPECPDGKVTFTSNKTCTASFMPVYTLTVAVSGAPSGKITSDPAGIECSSSSPQCSTTVAAGNKIALIPTTSQVGVTFTGWSGDCVASNLVTMDKNKQCTANFANTGTTQFSTKTYQVQEDAKQVVITVKRVSGSTGVLTTYYTTADGTAKIDGDYTATQGMLEWKDGDTSDKTFSIPINFDNDIEGNETVNLRLLNNSGGLRDEAVLTIVDVVIPNALQFSHPIARVNESDGKIKLVVVRAANSAGKVNVTYNTQDKDAIAGLDYTATTGTLVWENGDMERKILEIPILSNPNQTANTQFSVVLSNPQPANIAVLGPNTRVTVSIVNTTTVNDVGGSIQLEKDHYDVNESKGNIEILLKRLGSKVGSISALFSTQDGSAVETVDYIGKQQTVAWADGDDSDKSVIITIPYNSQPEADKVVNLTLSNPSPGANLGAIDKATLRIIDSYASPTTTTDPTESPTRGVIQFTTTNYQVEEGSVVALKVSRVGGSKDMVTVKYMTDNGTAKTGEDYIGRLGELTWLDTETADKTIMLTTLDNTLRDGDRNFTVSLMPIGTAAVSNENATVTVKDNDNTTVQFTNATFTAAENAGEATVSVSRLHGSQGDVIVYYQLQEATAKAGKDFALASGRLMWLDDDTADKTFTVKLYDNTTFDGNRDLKLLLTSAEAASLGAPSEATLTIVEDDSAVQGECTPQSDSVDCGFDNTGKNLENIKISEKGIVQGGSIAGKVESKGMVRDVSLQPGTQLIGGMVRGTVTGVESATNPARLIDVRISSATLQHVVIDAQSTLEDDVVLGAGVLFESNVTIPSVDLAQSLGTMTPTPPFPTASPFYAINLTRDVLFNSISGGIVTAINELYELSSWDMKLQQNPLTGYLEATVGNYYYAVMPTEVRQVLRQLLKGELQAGMRVAADGSVTFITHTGRWVRTIPVLHDALAFLTGLQGFGLNDFVVLPSGSFRVPVAETGIYYSARPSIFAMHTPSRSGIGLDVLRMPIVVNYGEANLWQQSLYPAAAQPEAIYALSKEATLANDGHLVLKLGSGDSQRTFYGTFDYVVTPGIAPQNGESLFYQIEDVNGDDIPDYRIVYPNGEGQLIFAQ